MGTIFRSRFSFSGVPRVKSEWGLFFEGSTAAVSRVVLIGVHRYVILMVASSRFRPQNRVLNAVDIAMVLLMLGWGFNISEIAREIRCSWRPIRDIGGSCRAKSHVKAANSARKGTNWRLEQRAALQRLGSKTPLAGSAHSPRVPSHECGREALVAGNARGLLAR